MSAQAPMTGMRPTLKRCMAMKAAMASTAMKVSKPPLEGHRAWVVNFTPRLRMTPTTAAVMAVSAALRRGCSPSFSMWGAPRKMKRKQGMNVTQVVMSAPTVAPATLSCWIVPPMTADELQHHDERAGRGLGEGETAHHLRMREPAVVFDGLLRNVRQHRIRAAEGDEGGLAEEQALLCWSAGPAEPCGEG